MSEDNKVSAKEAADISRASQAGVEDGRDNNYDPKSGDTPEQSDAYEEGYSKGRDQR